MAFAGDIVLGEEDEDSLIQDAVEQFCQAAACINPSVVGWILPVPALLHGCYEALVPGLTVVADT